MQEEEKNNGMGGMSVEGTLLDVQESYQEAQLYAQEENRTFTRTKFSRMDKSGTYRLHILPIAPSPGGSPIRPGCKRLVYRLLLELERSTTGNRPQKMYVTVTRTTDVGYSVNPIETYRHVAVEAAKEDGDDKLAEKIVGDSSGDGLKHSYGRCLHVFDLGKRAKGVQMMTLSHIQFKDLDEKKFKLWSKKLAKNPSYLCPTSSVCDAYLVEIERRKNRAKTKYVIPINDESGPVPLTKKELTTLMGTSCTPEIIYRYTRYYLGTTVESLKQCDDIYGVSLMETNEMKTVIGTLDGELPKEDISVSLFDRRTKDNRENGREGGGISLDGLSERYGELQWQELGEETEEDQGLRAVTRGYIGREGFSVRVTRSASNRELLDLIEGKMEGPKPSNEPEDIPGEEEEQPEETEERAGRPHHRR